MLAHSVGTVAVLLCCLVPCGIAEEQQPVRIQPAEARQHIGRRVEVVFEVRHTKNSEKRKTVFLDSEADFNDDKNLGIAINEQGLAELKEKRGVADPADFYEGKKIRVVGTVVMQEGRVYINVSLAEQLDLAPESAQR